MLLGLLPVGDVQQHRRLPGQRARRMALLTSPPDFPQLNGPPLSNVERGNRHAIALLTSPIKIQTTSSQEARFHFFPAFHDLFVTEPQDFQAHAFQYRLSV